jgi:DNA-directed RNA polymerase specialized sigma subunit
MTSPDTQTSARVHQLWDALHQARTGQQPRALTRAEDALFRYYLPMARSMADQHAPDNPDPDDLGQAAEVGLAQAILGWRHRAPDGFDRFARSAITAQLRRHDHLTRRGQPPPVGPRNPDQTRTPATPG